MSKTSDIECLQDQQITIRGLMVLDLRGIDSKVNINREIRNILQPQLDIDRIYSVKVISNYISGKQGHIREKETYYLARKGKTETIEYVELSSYPVYVLGYPKNEVIMP